MTGKIIINLMIEADLTSDIVTIHDKGDVALSEFAKDELQKIMNGDIPTVEWAGRVLGITIKKE